MEIMRSTRVLMCKPDYYFPTGISYEINKHMVNGTPVDLKLALQQWQNLKNALEQAGLSVNLIQQESNFPDMVFTANAGLVYKNQVILSNFRPHYDRVWVCWINPRKNEVQYFRKWFEDHDYFCKTLPQDCFFEGEGDFLWCQGQPVCGYGEFRTNELGARLAGNFVGMDPVLLRLVDPRFYHLDTCFCPIGDRVILYYPGAFDEASLKKIESLGNTIRVEEKDARKFVPNGVPVKIGNGYKWITAHMSDWLEDQLALYGIEVVELDMSEFIKAGGAAKCLTLFI